MGGEHAVLEPLGARQRLEVDLVEAPQVTGQRVRLALDPVAADVLEEIVMRMHAVQRRVRGMGLVKIAKQIVDEVGEGLGSYHRFGAYLRAVPDELDPPTRSVNGTINAALHMAGTLFVVATPIGNLEDITVRAIRILREVSVIAAEDTRRTAHLLARHAIATPTTSLHEHNEASKAASLVARLERGESIALVSDAGTPTVSDPGGHLIRQAIEAGIRVEAIPGPSAVLAILAASGLPTDTFSFRGFPPTRAKDRKRWFAELKTVGGTTVFFEAPHRITDTLMELKREVGDQSIVVGRELTKAHEELVRGQISDVLTRVRGAKGEFSVALFIGHEPNSYQFEPVSDDVLATEIGEMTTDEGMTKRKAINAVARRHGLTPNLVYQRLEAARKSGE